MDGGFQASWLRRFELILLMYDSCWVIGEAVKQQILRRLWDDEGAVERQHSWKIFVERVFDSLLGNPGGQREYHCPEKNDFVNGVYLSGKEQTSETLSILW